MTIHRGFTTIALMRRCNTCIRVVLADVLGFSRSPTKSSSFATIHTDPSWPRWQRRYASNAVEVRPASSTDHRLALMPHFTPHKQKAIAESLLFKTPHLQTELRYLKDPLKLADHVVTLLRQDEYPKALELVRMSSKDAACTVSWNHLIDYEMSKDNVTKAMSLYHDMKKRAQLPDARTFTILFRGLGNSSHPHQSLGQALSIYQSMFAENCLVKPSIIHTNAVLRVCSQAKDIDALYGIAAKLPTRGAGAADNLTFTTIMNAIRTVAWGQRDDATQEEKIARRYQAVLQGRRMWGDIIERWKKGDIFIDEELVCSMGRLLLIGNLTRDYDDIFSLIEQAMGIQRQLPRSNHPDRLTGAAGDHLWKQGGNTELPRFAARELNSSEEFNPGIQLPENQLPEDEPGSEFNPVGAHQSSFARPGCNTLSMVIDACVRLHAIRPAQDYWGLLTDPSGPYKVAPDADNYHMYLRLLRVQRASKLCIDLLQEMRHTSRSGGSILQPKTFRIALSTCVRDSNNPNVLDNASKLIRLMLDTLETPDVQTLNMYLEVAKHPNNRDWRTLLNVIGASVLGFRSLKSYLAYGDHGRQTRGVQQQPEEQRKAQGQKEEEVLGLACRLISIHDIVLTLGAEQMSNQEKQDLHGKRKMLTSWVTRRKGVGKSVENRGEEQRQREFANLRKVGRIMKDKKNDGFAASSMAFGNVESVETPPMEMPAPPVVSTYRVMNDAPAPRPSSLTRTVSDHDARAQNDSAEDAPGFDKADPGSSSPSSPSVSSSEGRKPFIGGTYRPSIIHAARTQEREVNLGDGFLSNLDVSNENHPTSSSSPRSTRTSPNDGWRRYRGSGDRPSMIYALRKRAFNPGVIDLPADPNVSNENHPRISRVNSRHRKPTPSPHHGDP